MLTDLDKDSDEAEMRDRIVQVLGKLKGLQTYFDCLPEGDIGRNVCGDLLNEAYDDAYYIYKILKGRL